MIADGDGVEIDFGESISEKFKREKLFYYFLDIFLKLFCWNEQDISSKSSMIFWYHWYY